MKNKYEVKILKPIVEGQNKGDINWMDKKGAELYQKEGLVKIIDKKYLAKQNKKLTPTKTKSITQQEETSITNPKNSNSCMVEEFIKRHKEFKGDKYIDVFIGDDKKTEKPPVSKIFNIRTNTSEEIKKYSVFVNRSPYGVFLNFNSLCRGRRIKKNVEKILYVFIDLDDAVEEHNTLLKQTLNSWGITYCYNAKSGGGFHILIPVELDCSKEDNVKYFLTYLKENICNKVDVATYTNERLIRFPKSLHNKYDDVRELETLHTHTPTKEEIDKNTILVLEHQLQQKKGKKDIIYQTSIKREDSFFSNILNNQDGWRSYWDVLNTTKEKHNNFIKNLGFFIANYPEYKPLATTFLNNWESGRVSAMLNWEKKAKEFGTNVLYFELLKWARKNKATDFIKLLEIQTKDDFLDRYEIYYLDDEKKDSAYLLYYPEKKYYVQKSLIEVLQTIVYNASEKGVDLANKFNLNSMDKWDEFSYKKQQSIVLSTLEKKLNDERRIKLVFNVNYEPTDDKFIYFENKKYFNIYNKTTLWDFYKKQNKYSFPNIQDLILNLVGGDEKSYIYFNKWLAWIVQNPTDKLPTAIIFQGKQGSGKGTFKNLILDNIFGSNCQEINQTHLESSFNEYLCGKQIIVANEVTHNENRLTLPNVLKNLVTDPLITISRKFKKEITGRNFTHWIFCSNSDNPIKIDVDDRRYSVFQSEKLKGGGKNASKFVQQLISNLDYELKEYISYLKSLDVKFEEVHEPIMTQAKEEIIELNKNSVERFLEYLNNFHDLETAFDTLEQLRLSSKQTNNETKVILTDLFYLAYKNYCHKFEERGKFNKQTFSKQLSNKMIKATVKYIPEEKKNYRVYDLEEINNVVRSS